MRETLRKEQLIQRILLISMILLSILLGTIIVNASDTGQPVKYYTSIEVEHNDTLWSLESDIITAQKTATRTLII